LPLDIGKTVVEFMNDLCEKLSAAQNYTKSHSVRELSRHAAHYNLRSKDKHFTVGERVLIFLPDSTVYSRWKGPAEIVAVKSPYSYLVEFDDARYHMHANKLRKFHVRVLKRWCLSRLWLMNCSQQRQMLTLVLLFMIATQILDL